jgi:hypothetical protein
MTQHPSHGPSSQFEFKIPAFNSTIFKGLGLSTKMNLAPQISRNRAKSNIFNFIW